jgi:hypothetical protein
MRGGSGGMFLWMVLIFILPIGLFMLGQAIYWLVTQHDRSTLTCYLPFALGFCLAGVGPLLFSGRYWLTTQRLLWKPWLGRSRALDHAQLKESKVDVSAFTHSLYISGPVRMKLDCIQKLERLWGAVTIFQNHGALKFDRDVSPVADLMWWKGNRVEGFSSQPGVTVLRPRFVVFLPTRPTIGLGSVALDVATGLAKAAVGIHEIRVAGSMPFELLLPLFAQSQPDRFDRNIQSLARFYGGPVWTRDAIKFSLKPVSLFKWKRLRFHNGKEFLNCAAQPKQWEQLSKLLQGWQELD